MVNIIDMVKNFINKIEVKKEQLENINFLELEVNRFKVSPERYLMITGERYYIGQHDILSRKREAIGSNGDKIELTNLPNNRIVDNQYKLRVDQKNSYLLGKPITFNTLNKQYAVILTKTFNRSFCRTLKNIGEDSLNGGKGWLYIYYNENGEFSFKRFRPYEVKANWKDDEHTILNYAIRLYTVIEFDRGNAVFVDKVEIYKDTGIDYYILTNGGRLKPTEPYHTDYFTLNGESYNWNRIPLIPFKFNSKELPLITRVKSLQDALNTIVSTFQNNMEEDVHNTILVLLNYGGENLGEFRKNLAQYGAVKLETVDGIQGDLKTLQIEVNANNYKAIIELLKKAIIENAMGYDAKDDRLSGAPNQLNIKSMYSDIDLEASITETEYQAAFEEVLWFLNMHLINTNQGDFTKEKVEVIFNRDMLINESEIVDEVNKLDGVISKETRISMLPFINDVQAELDKIKKENEGEMNGLLADEIRTIGEEDISDNETK